MEIAFRRNFKCGEIDSNALIILWLVVVDEAAVDEAAAESGASLLKSWTALVTAVVQFNLHTKCCPSVL